MILSNEMISGLGSRELNDALPSPARDALELGSQQRDEFGAAKQAPGLESVSKSQLLN